MDIFAAPGLETGILGALMALKPASYALRIVLAIVAFGAAMNEEKVLARVLGLGWLLVTGIALLLIGVPKGTVVDIALGLAALGAAAYSWWHTRS